MKKKRIPHIRPRLGALLLGLGGLAALSSAWACTRLVFHGANGQIVTARSMDWKSDIVSNLWVLPRGMERSGQAGPNSLRWTSRYGSVITSGYDISTTDGVNEAGLSANLLWLVESQYPSFDAGSKPGLTIAAWAQYVLDNFATVGEAVAALEKQPFTIVSDNVPGENRLTTLHLSMSDASGDSAIVEYIEGRQVIHHSRRYQVMTNSPFYADQLAILGYWQQIGGLTMLPGTNRASDRFVRASFYINAVAQSADPKIAVPAVMSVMRNVSVPYGISTPDKPHIASTRWRTVCDQKNRVYYFEPTLAMETFWVNLAAIDFSKGSGERTLTLAGGQSYAGDATAKFRKSAKPFAFLFGA